MAKSEYLTAPIKTNRMPPGVPFIVGNEAAERFSYYGMNSILVIFMTHYMMTASGYPDLLPAKQAEAWYHNFVAVVYGLCVLGAFLADAVLGKYRTILILSIAYCFGHFALAMNDTRAGLFLGFALIALGAGGIKPCVSANVGDQFGASNQHLLPRVYSWFYFSINAGSAVSTLLVPWLLDPPSFSQFSAKQINAPPALIAKLHDGAEPLSHYIWEQFSPEDREKMMDPKTPPAKQRELLAGELNSLLVVGSIFETNRFAGVELSPKTRELLAQHPTGQLRILLNRLLLSDAYPRDLAESPATRMGADQIRSVTRYHGSAIAFGTPGVFMVLATIIFWLGRKRFIHIPPAGIKKFFGEFLDYARFKSLRSGTEERGFQKVIMLPKRVFAALQYENLKALGNLLIIVPFAAMFWSLWQQNFSSWVLQAEKMDRHLFGINWLPAQIQTVNPLFILILLPVFSYAVYPALNKIYPLTPLRKFGIGLFTTVAAFLIVAFIQVAIDHGQTPHILWQILAFVVLTAAEVMVSVTHLEFAYTQAPRKMKSLVMCTYLGAVSLGNFFTARVDSFIQNADGSVKLKGATYFFFFVGVMLATALLFLLVAQFYRGKTYVQDEAEPQPA